MSNFISAIEKKLHQSQVNNFGIDNYDEYRFGEFPRQPAFIKIKKVIKNITG